ncbi:MAG TPA: MFS transporter [Chitinophagales bacterium]|nr:MFS transporter [Chitinophagales bacterium]
MSKNKVSFITIFIIVVAACGYFVDIYDLILFNVVKKDSLDALMPGATPEAIKSMGIFLFNMQMTGMLLGGLIWGVLGDKRGRLSVLFGSILLYSIANIINAFVKDIPLYIVVRVLAGIGLAGELGAGVTLVSETMSKENRGYGTMILVSFGALGAVAAALVGAKGAVIGALLGNIFHTTFANWQVAYLVGGTLGLFLLMLRVGTIESGMFRNIQHASVNRGDLMMLFTSRERFVKYLKCILVGLPIWYIVGLIVANSESTWAKELNIQGQVVNGSALMYSYIGLCVGDIFSGLLSQWLGSRRKVVIIYLAICFTLVVWFFFFSHGSSPAVFYLLTFLLGAGTGFWALFVTVAAEQFGTNIRSTVTNTTPNFVRGSVPLIMSLFQFLISLSLSPAISAFFVGVLCMGLSFWAIATMPETFGKDLDYVEDPLV